MLITALTNAPSQDGEMDIESSALNYDGNFEVG